VEAKAEEKRREKEELFRSVFDGRGFICADHDDSHFMHEYASFRAHQEEEETGEPRVPSGPRLTKNGVRHAGQARTKNEPMFCCGQAGQPSTVAAAPSVSRELVDAIAFVMYGLATASEVYV
jgi:hypothetical protein